MIWPVGSSQTAKDERLECGKVARRLHLCMHAPSLTVQTYVEGTSHIVQLVQSTHAARSLDSFVNESQTISRAPQEGGCHWLIENMPDRPRFLCHLCYHPLRSGSGREKNWLRPCIS
jgi:hypothetical protein